MAESVQRSQHGLNTDSKVLSSRQEWLLLELARALALKKKILIREEDSSIADY